MAGQWPELLPPLILHDVAMGGNGSILGKAVGSFIPFATLGIGSSPAVPSEPSQVSLVPPAPSPSDLNPLLLPSLSRCSWQPGVPSVALRRAHTASPML